MTLTKQNFPIWFAAIGGLVFLGAFGYTEMYKHAEAVESEAPIPACVLASETTQLLCVTPTHCLECRPIAGALACYETNAWDKCIHPRQGVTSTTHAP